MLPGCVLHVVIAMPFCHSFFQSDPGRMCRNLNEPTNCWMVRFKVGVDILDRELTALLLLL
jgi:hypothetical protein